MSHFMTNAQVRETLLKAAAIVRQGWCIGALAKDANGRPCGPRDQRAVAWCAVGAIQKICGGPNDGFEVRYALRQVLCREIQDWNDTWAKDGENVAKTMEEAANYAVGKS